VLSSAFNGTHHLAVPPHVASAPRLAEVTLGIGAGLYEELIFRLVLISVLVIIGVDLLRWPREATTLACVLIAAALFAAHHHPPLGSEPFALNRFLFRATAGIYLGGVFVYRGYGPAAGLHIAHNLMVIAMAG
jgi:membrane protease YdiL (CAAX protease family)